MEWGDRKWSDIVQESKILRPVVCKKVSGYKNRHLGVVLSNPGEQPHSTAPMLRQCTYSKCDRVEPNLKTRFRHCQYCLTVYCSKECSEADYGSGDHKNFCLSKSYEQQLKRWRDEEQPIAYWQPKHRDAYERELEVWQKTKRIQALLKRQPSSTQS